MGVICANNGHRPEKLSAECEALGGGRVHVVAKRQNSEEN